MNETEMISKSKRYYEGRVGAHDWLHVMRVLSNAKQICVAEGADEVVVNASVYFHDCVCYPKGSAKSKDSARDSATEAVKVLGASNFPKDKLALVRHCIEAHSFSGGAKPESLEAMVLSDADKLDAIGAIGIARAFATSATMDGGRQFYNLDDPFCEKRQPDDMTYAVDHFYRKLLKLQGLMQTKTGKAMALERHEFMEEFLAQLKKEI